MTDDRHKWFNPNVKSGFPCSESDDMKRGNSPINSLKYDISRIIFELAVVDKILFVVMRLKSRCKIFPFFLRGYL